MIFNLNFKKGHSLLTQNVSSKETKKFQVQKQMKTLSVLNVVKKGHFAKDCFSKTTSEPSYKFSVNSSSSWTRKFQPKMLQSTQSFQNKTEKYPQNNFEAMYRKAKAKLSLLEEVP